GREWNDGVMFNLPDYDVFKIDATANPPAEIASYPGVGTILFNMAINPSNGKVYVTNTDANNDVRFEGTLDPNDPNDSSVQGHLHEARVTIIDSSCSAVEPQHLNPHIDYDARPIDPQLKERTLSQPTGIAVSADGSTAYVAALGSSKVGIFDTDELEDGTFEPDASNHIALAHGGPTGLVLDETRKRMYVMTRFDNGISTVGIDPSDIASYKVEIHHRSLHNPEPDEVVAGRPFLYDAYLSSNNGEASCASCHIFGDFDSLAWDLGDPDGGEPAINPNPVQPGLPVLPRFHPMKGPMTTQTLRGLKDHGAMHWRGDRTGAGRLDELGNPIDPFDPAAAFKEFNGAFQTLLGRTDRLEPEEMAAFTNFILHVTDPPNPIRNLDNSLTPVQQIGSDFFFQNRSDGGDTRCNTCHTIAPERRLFGTSRGSLIVGMQSFKVAHFRNLYQKVGMFGQPRVEAFLGGLFFNTWDEVSTGDQVRGFGYLHDGTIDTMFRFMHISAFNHTTEQPEGFEGTEDREGVAMFLLASDSNMAPIVGQQVTLTSTNHSAVDARINLMLARCSAALECDLVAKGVKDGIERGWLYDRDNSVFVSDIALETPISAGDLRTQAQTAGQELTFTAVPRGSGHRIGIDRDQDGHRDGDERAAQSDPADPDSTPL
ncbi:MAG TPA: hypothetical protein VEB21_11910, partial [Terriglobales bacterium]|nr:hypothetical protein [Terriglobales bacterium]